MMWSFDKNALKSLKTAFSACSIIMNRIEGGWEPDDWMGPHLGLIAP